MGKYKFDAETIRRDIRLRSGTVRHVDLIELSEGQLRQRQNLIVDPASTRGRGRGSGTSIRLDRQRKYDFKNCIDSWDLKLSDLVKAVEEDSPQDEILPLEEDVFKELPASVSEQIAGHIREIMEEPEEDLPDSDYNGDSDDSGDQEDDSKDDPEEAPDNVAQGNFGSNVAQPAVEATASAGGENPI